MSTGFNMRLFRTFALALLVALLLGCAFLGGYVVREWRAQNMAVQGADYSLYWQVHDLLASEFIGEIPAARAQLYAAIRGLVGSYNDPYTVFVEPAPRELERDDLAGHFGGIGAYMSRNEAGDVVITVIRDRPAARAGIQDGDVLLAVDDQPITREMPLEQVIALVRGDEGTRVKLTLRRADKPEPLDVVVVRERITVPSVEWRVLDQANHVGYIRIGLFGELTTNELKTAINELAAQGTDKLVLDLRGNNGGLLDVAVDVTSQFLRQGVVLREVKRGGVERFYSVKLFTTPAQEWPIALLVDGGTASASEIVAGALRDHARAVLIGEKTYGKGSVQMVHELADGSSLHVTTARWLTPDRHQLDNTGLEPDVPVPFSAADRDAGRDPQLTRATAWLLEKR
jgi:carboxyl-terminal processing protease